MTQNEENWFESEEDARRPDGFQRSRWKEGQEAPKRSPMRRKDRSHTGGFEQKHKRDERRDEKRKNSRLKYDW